MFFLIPSWAYLTHYMTLIQGMAKLWIHLFTGMRDNEVNQLSSDCYQTVQSNEHLVHVIMGYTSKWLCCTNLASKAYSAI